MTQHPAEPLLRVRVQRGGGSDRGGRALPVVGAAARSDDRRGRDERELGLRDRQRAAAAAGAAVRPQPAPAALRRALCWIDAAPEACYRSMAMRSRLPALLALTLALAALPGVRAFANAMCAPCCPERSAAADPACEIESSDCCELVPAAPAAPEPVKAKPVTPALSLAPRPAEPIPASHLAPLRAREFASRASALQLSVVRRL